MQHSTAEAPAAAIEANSPAAEKQLQPGDVILEVDQKSVTSPAEVIDIVGKLQQQKKRSVLLFVERQGDPPGTVHVVQANARICGLDRKGFCGEVLAVAMFANDFFQRQN